MKKRLLFALMAMCVSVSGFALSRGEFVYTPQGRFQITGDNLNANNAFQTMDGWTVVGEGKTLADLFMTNADGYATGSNSVVSQNGEALNEGMYFKFEPTDAGAAYVVSFKMKGSALDNVRCRPVTDGYNKTYNLVKIEGNSDNVYGGETEVKLANTAEELTEEWQTFNYAIVGDGIARTWFISFIAMATTIEIADLQIAPAMQFADLRQRDAMLEKLKAYKNCYEWPAEALADINLDEPITDLQGIGNESGQAELDEMLTTAQEILDEFVKKYMDDFLASNSENYLGVYEGEKNLQKLEYIGDWYGLPDKRIHWSVGFNPDLGHFGGNNSWCYNAPDNPIGLYMQTEMDPGSYVFAIEASAALREDPTSSSWTTNEGWNPAYGVAYIVKIVDGVATDTIASVVKDLDSFNFTPFIVVAKLTEEGNYEVGFKAFCKDAFKNLKNGSVVNVKDASLWVKDSNKYNKKQRTYEENVRTQIATGREYLEKTSAYIADESYYWGKADLMAVIQEIQPKIMAYEALNQDEIIATYDEDTYTNTVKDESGLLQFEVYDTATKYIIAANNKFVAVNDTLNSIQVAIDNAEAVMAMRLYDAATGRDALQEAIYKAQDVQATMKALDYSEENAAAIVAANAELAEAVETFKASVPEDAIATLVDIDFEQDAVLQSEENNTYTIGGAKGSMEITPFSTEAAVNQEFEKGYWSNGEQLWKGYLRIGRGTGTVAFDPTENGTMGTNILKVACDFYVQGLSGKSLGFYLKDDADTDIFGLFHNFYNGTTTTNTCNVDISKIWAKAGGSYNNASPADVTEEEGRTANPLQKSHIEVVMDYGKKTMYCTIQSINGSTASEEVACEAIPAKFVLQCDYNNNDRRAWFDNLKIERISAGAVDAIQTVKAISANAEAIYNLAGQKVLKAQKGLYIQNGKKIVVK